MLLYAPCTLRFSLRRSISRSAASGRWAQSLLPRNSVRASANVHTPRSWLSSSRDELPPHSHLKVPDFGGKGTVLKWLKAVGDPVQEGELMVDMGFSAFDVELVSDHNGFLAEVMVPAGTAVDPETPLAVIVPDLDYVPFFTKDFAPALPAAAAAESSFSSANIDPEPATASSSSPQLAANDAYENGSQASGHNRDEFEKKEPPSDSPPASDAPQAEVDERNNESDKEGERSSESPRDQGVDQGSAPPSPAGRTSEVEAARSHAQALAAAQSAAQAEAQLAIAKAKALELAVEAAEAAATAAEEAAGISGSLSKTYEDEEGISSLTLLKMVKTVVSSPEMMAAAAAGEGGGEGGEQRPLSEAEIRELKDMALRESQTLQHCFVAASDTDNGKPAPGESLPEGFNSSDFFAFVLPHVKHALAAKSRAPSSKHGSDEASEAEGSGGGSAGHKM